MKTKLLVVSSLLLTTLSLNAADYELQLVAGKDYCEIGKTTHTESNTAGVRLNTFLSKNNGIQVAYDKVRNLSGSKDAHRYSANYIHQQNENNSNLHPFILLGGGHEDGIAQGQGFFNAGAGVSYAVNNRVNLIAEVKAIKKHLDSDKLLNTNLGLGLVLGKTACNKAIAEDYTANYVAPKMVTRKYISVEPTPLPAPVFIDDKVNCVRN